MQPLRHHGRFPYTPIVDRPKGLRWPNGSKVAVYFGINHEHFAFGEGLGGQLVPGQSTTRSPDILNYSWREYGNRVGAFRLLKALDELKMPASALFNGAVVEHAPAVYEAHVKRGDEIVGHGWTNAEKQGDMTLEEERACITETTDALTKKSLDDDDDKSKPPSSEVKEVTGWLGPWISQTVDTPDLLVEAGYSYLMDWAQDDVPTYMKTTSGTPILSLPYPQEINDIPCIMVRRASASEFADMIIDNLQELLIEDDDGPPVVMGVALHPYIVGQPFRLHHLRRALAKISQAREANDIWLTTAGDIAQAWRTMVPPTPDDCTKLVSSDPDQLPKKPIVKA